MSASLRLALLYGALFFGPGVAMPFLPLFLAGRGMSPEAVALALGMAQAGRLVSGPLGGRLADQSGDRRGVIVGAALLAAAGALLLVPGAGFAALSAALMLHGAGAAPLTPLVDTVALGAGVNFGRVRAFGSLAFVAGILAGAWVIGGLSAEMVPWIVAGALLVTAAIASGLPRLQQAGVGTQGLALALLRRPGFLLLIVAAGLVQGSHAAYYALSTLYWQAAGLGAGAIGLLWSIGVAAEIVLLFFARGLLVRLPPLRLAGLGAAAAAVRWLGTAATVAFVPLLALQALHALSFAASLLASLALVQRLVPPEAAATAQALQAALGPGLAMLLLTFASGPIFAAVGGGVFLVMAGVAGLGLGAVLVLSRRMPA